MKTATIVWIVVVIVIIFLGGWYFLSYGNNSTTPPATTTTTTTGTTTPAPSVTVGSSATLGPVLVAANGMTLYTYNKDTSGVSNCAGQCLSQWPAYTPTAGTALIAGTGVNGTLATITRTDDGATQLTYNGMPLYFFVQDTAPGDATGQNVNGFTVAKP